MLEHAQTRVRSNLSQRSKMLHDLPEYCAAILKILKFPGLCKHLRAQSMEIFLHGRTILVYSLFGSCVHAASNCPRLEMTVSRRPHPRLDGFEDDPNPPRLASKPCLSVALPPVMARCCHWCRSIT